MTDLAGKTVTIVGTARSGWAAAKLVLSRRGRVKLTEEKILSEVAADIRDWCRDKDVPLQAGGHTQDFIQGSDLLVVSPGVWRDAPPVVWAETAGIPVIAEIELAASFCPCPIIAVTGSNGKTTVVNLIARILEAAGRPVCLCGNIGTPFAGKIQELTPQHTVVLEVSSFQLERIVDFHPSIAVLLNFSENHLDRHQDIDEYWQSKIRVFLNQEENDHAVLNGADPRLQGLAKGLRAQAVFFEQGAAAANPNFAAAREVARLQGIGDDVCQKVFGSFCGIEHRLEKVRTLNGIDFINDSKSTTAEAGRWALQRAEKPAWLICGGRDKNIEFLPLRDLVKEKVKGLFLIGEATAKLRQAFADLVPTRDCQDLQEAICAAYALASAGQSVLLSPMCASFDMFENYEQRGKEFKRLVRELS